MKNKKKGVNFHIILYVCKNRLLFGIRLTMEEIQNLWAKIIRNIAIANDFLDIFT